jgi:transposase
VLGVGGAVVEDVRLEAHKGEDVLVVAVRPGWRSRSRCGICQRRCPGLDAGGGRRRWRALDLGTIRTYLEAGAPRVSCPEHGAVVAYVPWARHDARLTRSFDDTAAWLATHCSKSAVGELLRVAWRTVGRIITRVVDEAEQASDRLDGLKRIGIDEISHRKGHRYLTVVVDHDSGRLVWAAPGRDSATLERFFVLLGPQRCEQIRLVSADAAGWIRKAVVARCPKATLCMDPFHVVQWATDALDAVRREVWRAARKAGQTGLADEVKGARFALWKNPENLTDRQQERLAVIQKTNAPLYRAYLLKEQLRAALQRPVHQAMNLLRRWVSWARRCRLAPFVELARTIDAYWEQIAASLQHGLSNARIESTNTKIRLITRRSFGFHSPEAVIALAMLSLGGLCPPLPGRR